MHRVDGGGSATLSMAQGERVQLFARWVDSLTRSTAGAEFAEYVIQAAFGGKQVRTVQAYIDLGAEAGGAAVQKEIGADLAFFSVNIQLGVGDHPNPRVLLLTIVSAEWCREDLAHWQHGRYREDTPRSSCQGAWAQHRQGGFTISHHPRPQLISLIKGVSFQPAPPKL